MLGNLQMMAMKNACLPPRTDDLWHGDVSQLREFTGRYFCPNFPVNEQNMNQRKVIDKQIIHRSVNKVILFVIFCFVSKSN